MSRDNFPNRVPNNPEEHRRFFLSIIDFIRTLPIDIGRAIGNAESKATPVDADSLGMSDSEASNGLKRLTWANLKATLRTYFDTIYLKLTGGTMQGEINFAGYRAIALACDNGSSFPSSPSEAQWFYRDDIDTLFIYEGGWRPIISFSALTLYVDGTNGTDAVGQGYTSGSGATRTVQYAVNLIPPIYGGDITVNIAAGTYRETVTIEGKEPSGNFGITIIGALSLVDSGNLSTASHLGGNGASAWGLLNDVTKAWAVSSVASNLPSGGYVGKLLVTTGVSGTAVERIIDSTVSATQLRIQGMWSRYMNQADSADIPANGTAYSVYDFATRITGADAGADTTGVRSYAMLIKSPNVTIRRMKANYVTDTVVYYDKGSSGQILSCEVGNGTLGNIIVNVGAVVSRIQSVWSHDGANNVNGYLDQFVHNRLNFAGVGIQSNINASINQIAYCRLSGGVSASPIVAQQEGVLILRTCNYIHNSPTGANITQNSYMHASTFGSLGTLATTVFDTCTTGINAILGGRCNNPGAYTYVACTVNYRQFLDSSTIVVGAGTASALNNFYVLGTAGFGGAVDRSEFEADGTLRFSGAATVWRDVMFPMAPPKTTGAGNPTLVTYNGNMRAYSFAVNDAHDFDPQEIVHEAKVGSTATWHIHWINRSNDGTNRAAKYEIEFDVETDSGAIAAPTVISAEFTIPAGTAINTPFRSDVGTFVLPTIARIVGARLKRIASAGTAPSVDPVVRALHFHFEVDTIGSRAITTK